MPKSTYGKMSRRCQVAEARLRLWSRRYKSHWRRKNLRSQCQQSSETNLPVPTLSRIPAPKLQCKKKSPAQRNQSPMQLQRDFFNAWVHQILVSNKGRGCNLWLATLRLATGTSLKEQSTTSTGRMSWLPPRYTCKAKRLFLPSDVPQFGARQVRTHRKQYPYQQKR